MKLTNSKTRWSREDGPEDPPPDDDIGIDVPADDEAFGRSQVNNVNF